MKKVAGWLIVSLAAFGQNTDSLKRDFENPPATARPRVWWHWMNGNVTQEGIQYQVVVGRRGIALQEHAPVDQVHGELAALGDSEKAMSLVQKYASTAPDELEKVFDALQTHPDCSGRIGSVGFCFGGRMSLALGISRPTFYELMEKLGIHKNDTEKE